MKNMFTAALLVAAALFYGCDNPAGEDAAAENSTAAVEPLIEVVEGFFVAEAVAGAQAAVFTFSEYGGPWEAKLVAGENSAHNDKFVIAENTLCIGSAALAAGVYKVRVRITGAAYKKDTAFEFKVTNTPVAFKKPPVVTPYMGDAPNRNRLSVSWTRQPGASGYKVFISTANATRGLTPAATVTGSGILRVDTISGYTELPDGAWFYVWVKAFNVDSETDFSPVKKQKTSDPIEAFWYTGDLDDFDKYYPHRSDVDGMGWDSGYDNYMIKPLEDGSGVYFKYNGGTSGEAFNNESRILYHRRFDPVEAEQASRLPQAQDGSLMFQTIGKMFYLSGLPLRLPSGCPPLAGSLPVSGLPAEAQGRFAEFGYPADGVLPPSGVFIIKDTSATGQRDGRYYATFYHGMAALHPNAALPPNILVVFGNAAYGFCMRTQKPGVDFSRIAMYSPSFEHAVDNYPDVDYYNYQIAYVAVPWLRRDIAWAGSKSNQGGDSDAGWIAYPSRCARFSACSRLGLLGGGFRR